MLVMLDQPINHMAAGDISQHNPFNVSSDFHDCSGTRSSYCCSMPCARLMPLTALTPAVACPCTRRVCGWLCSPARQHAVERRCSS